MTGWRKRVRWALRCHPVLFRARDRLLTRAGDPSQYWAEDANRWNPFVPPCYWRAADAMGALDPSDEWPRAVAMVVDLDRRRGRPRGLSVDSARALEGVLAGQGTCSDRSQVFVGLCLAAGIRVREWAANLAEAGHAFCEVYSTDRARWLLIDPSHAVQVLREDGEPVGVFEVLDATRSGRLGCLRAATLDDRPIDEGSGPWTSGSYLDPDVRFRLLAHNRMFDQDVLLRLQPRVPLVLVHVALVALGRYQRFWSYGAEQAPQISANRSFGSGLDGSPSRRDETRLMREGS